MSFPFTNELIDSSSPYLLQHSHNPVNWVEWSDEAFEQAEKEGKLVLISIGYSACHWCHVMEHESFENEAVAELMNKHLVCIKVDREERPDVDQIYMDAVQLMTQQGGWPLNCFTLPDGRPIFGGTYFPNDQWQQIIRNLWDVAQESPEKVEKYATKLTKGIQLTGLVEQAPLKESFDDSSLLEGVKKWKTNFDFERGGNLRVPKFPLPNNYEFLLQYGTVYKDETVLNQVHKTLESMAYGGIYDQLKGGFSRYSVDEEWKVPHFEKMLYDNGQLLSLYAKAYQQDKNPLYKKVIQQTTAWLCEEMQHKDGGFFSALDADSEGIEGRFYTWTKQELQTLLKDDFNLFSHYNNVNEKGYWEDEQYILRRTASITEFCNQAGFTEEEFTEKLTRVHELLLSVREKRIRPGLDDKQLTAWNAITAKGFADAGIALNDSKMIQKAVEIGNWITTNQLHDDCLLYRTRKDGHSKINGFLEDYAQVIQAFITLYEATFDLKWLNHAKNIMDYTLSEFFDETSSMFFYTEKNTSLLARKMEINDNVIPASNSVMARNLFWFGKCYRNDEYLEISKQMLVNIYDQIPNYGSGYSNWMMLAVSFLHPFKEVIITGEDALENRFSLGKNYFPNILFAGGKTDDLPILKEKEVTSPATIYVCENNACKAPTQSLKEAEQQLEMR